MTDVDLPWDVAGAIRLDDQAELHPRRFLLAVADGARRTSTSARASPGSTTATRAGSRTEAGPEVTARDVVVATHFPTLDRGLFFARLAAERSYALGVRARGAIPHGMFLSTESPSHSVRAAPHDGGELLIVGGESHKAGTDDPVERYAQLESWARERFDVAAVEYRWSAQDTMPVDGIPYVGKLSPISRHVWTASGFKKWGFTNAAAAALMLADAIGGIENPWAATFDANRFKPLASASNLLKEGLSVGAHFFGDRLASPDVPSLDQLAPGEGGIVKVDGDKVAAFRDDDGVVHAVSPLCTHQYCQVAFNAAERSWDCPCHGSRFATDGAVLEGPAVNPLERRELAGAAPRPRARPGGATPPCPRATPPRCASASSSRRPTAPRGRRRARRAGACGRRAPRRPRRARRTGRGPSGKARSRTARTSAPGPCGIQRRSSAPGLLSSISSSGPSTSASTMTGTPAGMRGSEAAIAGRTLGSPTIRCQSASGSGAYAPPGPMSWSRSPGRARRRPRPATPVSPWTTKSIVSRRRSASNSRTV